jgi:hypothetical protein
MECFSEAVPRCLGQTNVDVVQVAAGREARRFVMVPRSIADHWQVRGIGEAAERWQRDHKEAMEIGYLEEVLALCVEVVERQAERHRQAFRELFAGEFLPVQEFGEAQTELHAALVEMLDRVADKVSLARQAGYTLEGEGSFVKARKTARFLKEDFGVRWPLAVPN